MWTRIKLAGSLCRVCCYTDNTCLVVLARFLVTLIRSLCLHISFYCMLYIVQLLTPTKFLVTLVMTDKVIIPDDCLTAIIEIILLNDVTM